MDPITVTATVQENDAADPGDGGRVRLVAILPDELQAAGWTQINALLIARTDEALLQFPSTRPEKESRRFEITIREIARSADPVTPPPAETVEEPAEAPGVVVRQGVARKTSD